ncbi:MAG TPA: hypothetical protein VNK49_08870 [Anaerolineales bacterium]|nr:hypothetical protein [Anaerolineales bacterium]
MRNKLINALLAVCFFTMFVVPPASAQDSNPPGGAWAEVVDANGNINFSNLTDGGVITQPADWMPSIPGIGQANAEYHVYYTPGGNTVVVPTLTTYLFMAMNPDESGLSASVGALSMNAENSSGYATDSAFMAGILSGNLSISDYTSFVASGFTNWGEFFSSVNSGETDIWSFPALDSLNFLFDLIKMGSQDANLYSVLLLYTPDQCIHVPGGCTAEQLSLLLPPPTLDDDPPTPSVCPAPVVEPGRIVRSGQLVYPNFPLVVGQDPDKTGVDISVTVYVEPTIRRTWTPEPVTECRPGPNANGVTNCTTQNGQAGHEKVVDWECKEHVETYNECISFASTVLRLSDESKDWILNELSIRYPGAYLHNPRIALGSERSCSISETYEHIQTADPGWWDITISGQTSGTPITAPRNFSGAAGRFSVWLKETAIIK